MKHKPCGRVNADHQNCKYGKQYLLRSLKSRTFTNIYPSLFPLFFVIFSVLFIGISEAKEISATETGDSQARQIEKDLLEQQGALVSTHRKEKGILEEIERLQREVVQHKRSLQDLSSRIQDISCEIRRGKKRVQQLNHSSHAVREYLRKRLVTFYKFGRFGYILVLASPSNLQEFQRTIKYMKTIMAQDNRALNLLKKQRGQIERELDGLEKNAAKMKELKQAKHLKMAELETYIEKKVLLLMKIHKEKEFYEKAVQELENATRSLNETMIHLKAEQRGITLPRKFSKMKGKLSLPVHGEILGAVKQSGFNPLRHRKGIYIKGSPGGAVRSVFPGRVDYSGWFKGYGQLLIVDHGYHYFTVFAHLEERIKKKGDTVSEGEIVGLVGDPGWEIGPGVYFEIRRGGDQLDPQKWLRK